MRHIRPYIGKMRKARGIGALAFIPLFILVLAVPNILLATVATVFHSTTWTLAYREIKRVDGGQETELVEARVTAPAAS